MTVALSFVKFISSVSIPVKKMQPSVLAEPKMTESFGYDITADDALTFVRIESLRPNLPNPNDAPICVPMANVASFRVKDDPNTLGALAAKKAEEK